MPPEGVCKATTTTTTHTHTEIHKHAVSTDLDHTSTANMVMTVPPASTPAAAAAAPGAARYAHCIAPCTCGAMRRQVHRHETPRPSPPRPPAAWSAATAAAHAWCSPTRCCAAAPGARLRRHRISSCRGVFHSRCSCRRGAAAAASIAAAAVVNAAAALVDAATVAATAAAVVAAGAVVTAARWHRPRAQLVRRRRLARQAGQAECRGQGVMPAEHGPQRGITVWHIQVPDCPRHDVDRWQPAADVHGVHHCRPDDGRMQHGVARRRAAHRLVIRNLHACISVVVRVVLATATHGVKG
eukprot:361008-Chlamydomonas_euryale.AAC.3